MKKVIFPVMLISVLLIGTNVAQTTGKRHDIKTTFSIDSTYSGTSATGTSSGSPTAKDTIEMNIGTLRDYGGGAYVVELEPKYESTEYVFPIVIGQCEMRGINSKKNGEIPPRPMTYDLMTNIMKETGVKLTKIVITRLEGGTYYAVLILNSNNKKFEIDSRPSDAINLALRSNVPVYSLRTVFDKAKELKSK